MKRLLVVLGTVAIGVAPGIADASKTALLLGGKGEYAELTDEQMATAMGGIFSEYDARISVPFPGSDDFSQSVAIGADNLYAAVYATPGFKTIGGVSEGAPAVIEVLRRLVEDIENPTPGRTPPPAHELNVTIYGSPSRALFVKLPYQEFAESPYNVVIVKAEYDGIADFPDKPWNLLAVANAAMGASQLHVDRAYYDILQEPTKYTVVTNKYGATLTSIMIPTPLLPLLKPLSDSGATPGFVQLMDRMLRPVIDSAYNRPKWTVGVPDTLPDAPGTTTASGAARAALASAGPAELPRSVRKTLVDRSSNVQPQKDVRTPESLDESVDEQSSGKRSQAETRRDDSRRQRDLEPKATVSSKADDDSEQAASGKTGPESKTDDRAKDKDTGSPSSTRGAKDSDKASTS